MSCEIFYDEKLLLDVNMIYCDDVKVLYINLLHSNICNILLNENSIPI